MMDYRIATRLLKEARIVNAFKNYRYGYNKVRPHSRFESLEHFITKAMMSYLIFKKQNAFITEADCRNGRVLDILQITHNKNFVGYEIESKNNNKADVDRVDIIEIPLKNMPNSSKRGLTDLENWLRRYLV